MAVGVAAPTSAAGEQSVRVSHAQQRSTIDWGTHDTAVYVVSTVNVLRTRTGRPIGRLLRHKLGVRRYNVYADGEVTDLYFIDMVKLDGTSIGTLAYKMGWQKPMSLSSVFDNLSISQAPNTISTGYKSDKKTLIGSFTSTMPQ